jgi:hypothetical protein
VQAFGLEKLVQQSGDLTDSQGVAPTLTQFLSAYAAVMDGDLTKWSIGGPPAQGLVSGIGSGIGLLGTPQGLSGSHNKYEGDASPTRPDLYVAYVTTDLCFVTC